MVGRENVGRLKVIIRWDEIAGARETVANPRRLKAEASVGTRHELPSAASAVIARIAVRVIVVVSTKGFVSVLSFTPLCTRVHPFAARLQFVYRAFTFRLRPSARPLPRVR